MKISKLRYNPATDRYELDGYGLHCGDCFEVRLPGSDEWIATRIESNSDGWYLIGLRGQRLEGLTARY